jgi:hypothetical protein
LLPGAGDRQLGQVVVVVCERVWKMRVGVGIGIEQGFLH